MPNEIQVQPRSAHIQMAPVLGVGIGKTSTYLAAMHSGKTSQTMNDGSNTKIELLAHIDIANLKAIKVNAAEPAPTTNPGDMLRSITRMVDRVNMMVQTRRHIDTVAEELIHGIRTISSRLITVVASQDLLAVYLLDKKTFSVELGQLCHEPALLANARDYIPKIGDVVNKIRAIGTRANLRWVPVKVHHSPLGNWIEYKLYRVGDPLDFSSVEKGVRIASHFHSRYDVSLHVTQPQFTSTEVVLQMHYDLTAGQCDTAPDRLIAYSVFKSAGVDSKYWESSKVIDRRFNILEARGLIDGKVQSVMVCGLYLEARLENLTHPSDFARCYRDFKNIARRAEYCVPNPNVDMAELLSNPLVHYTLRAIISTNTLLIANHKFYRMLRHLGLILDENNILSAESRLHAWRIYREHNTEARAQDTLVTMTTTSANHVGVIWMNGDNSGLLRHYEVKGDVYTLQQVATPKQVESYRKLTKTLNIDFKEGV